MDYQDTVKKLGTHSVTATFGVSPPQEIVGPLNPETVHYGVAYPSTTDTGNVLTNLAIPTLHFGFNKYRPDLPPWKLVREIVLASYVENDEPASGTVVAHFIDPSVMGIRTTGDLKTVTLAADGPGKGTEGLEIIDRSGVEDLRQRKGL